MSFFDKTYTYAYWKPLNEYNIITRSNNGKLLYYIYVFTSISKFSADNSFME